jgi:hypothetical protein
LNRARILRAGFVPLVGRFGLFRTGMGRRRPAINDGLVVSRLDSGRGRFGVAVIHDRQSHHGHEQGAGGELEPKYGARENRAQYDCRSAQHASDRGPAQPQHDRRSARRRCDRRPTRWRRQPYGGPARHDSARMSHDSDQLSRQVKFPPADHSRMEPSRWDRRACSPPQGEKRVNARTFQARRKRVIPNPRK